MGDNPEAHVVLSLTQVQDLWVMHTVSPSGLDAQWAMRLGNLAYKPIQKGRGEKYIVVSCTRHWRRVLYSIWIVFSEKNSLIHCIPWSLSTTWEVSSCSLASGPPHCWALEICPLGGPIALKLSSCCASFSTSKIILIVSQRPFQFSSWSLWQYSYLKNLVTTDLIASSWFHVQINHTQRSFLEFVCKSASILSSSSPSKTFDILFLAETKTNLGYWHLSFVTTSLTDLLSYHSHHSQGQILDLVCTSNYHPW